MKYEVAISYASEDDGFTSDLNEELGLLGVITFKYTERNDDRDNQELNAFLERTYGKSSAFVVLVTSTNYHNRQFTRIEESVALTLSAERIFVVKLDNTSFPKLNDLNIIQAGVMSTALIAAEIMKSLAAFRAKRDYHLTRHPGDVPGRTAVTSEHANKIIGIWVTKRASYFDGFLRYDVDYLRDQYAKEEVLTSAPYVEIADWTGAINSNDPIRFEFKADETAFEFDKSSANLDEIRELGYAARRARNLGSISEFSISLHRYDALAKKFCIRKARYHDQHKSNMNMDFQGEVGQESIRMMLSRKYGSRLSPLGSRELADTVGVAVLLYYREGTELFPYFVPRSKSAPVFPGGWHCSASGAAQWPERTGTEEINSDVFLNDLYNEIREEIGLFRSIDEKQKYVLQDKDYKDHGFAVDNLYAEDITYIWPVALCRELLRGGKPQMFYIGFTSLNRDELIRRRRMASMIAKNQKRREEIDSRLLQLMPGVDQLKNLRRDTWEQHLLGGGFTFEVPPLLHYASKVNLDRLCADH